MKRKGLLLIMLLLISALIINAQDDKKLLKVVPDSTATDSTEYELVVFDQGFETWLLMQPQNQHSLGYYRAKNRLYVNEWNYRYMDQARYGSQYGSYIDYNPNIDYGLDFERRLYYYFKYFEETNGIALEPGRR